MKVEGLDSLKKKLDHLAKVYFDGPVVNQPSVIVGYTAAYAVYTHENLEPAEGARGRARVAGRQGKYLEQPARELNNDGTLGGIVTKALQRGATLIQALYLAGLAIQRASQKLVPVDTGNLRGSAFTRKE